MIRVLRKHYLPVALLCMLVLPVSVVACSTTGGVLGGSWQVSGLVGRQIVALTAKFQQTQDIFAGDEQGHVYFSSDSGTHWSERSDGLPLSGAINALLFDAAGTELFAATNSGLFGSTDSGQHWMTLDTTKNGLPADEFTALAYDVNGQHTLYVGAAQHGVYLTINDGASWTLLGQGLPAGVALNGLSYDPNQHQLWAATAQGIYQLKNAVAGAGVEDVWQAANTGLPVATTVYTVQVAESSGGVAGLMFAGTNHGFYLSQDGGADWTPGQADLGNIQVFATLVDFRAAQTVYVGTNVGAYRSVDGGHNWDAVGPGLPTNRPIYALAIGGSNNAQLFAGGDNVYLFPGNSGGLDLTKLLPFVIFAILMYVLYRYTRRDRYKKRKEAQSAGESAPVEPGQSAASNGHIDVLNEKKQGR